MNRLVFNTFSVPTGNSYQLENSYAAFSWQRAAVLGPVKLDQTETAKLYTQQSDDDDDRTKERAWTLPLDRSKNNVNRLRGSGHGIRTCLTLRSWHAASVSPVENPEGP
jgi:hypothetical protein